MACLKARLLGGCEFLDDNGNEVTLPTRKARALLAYLALRPGEWLSRERLASLLWSDRGEPQARHSLNQALHAIRKLGDSILEGDPSRIRLRGSAVQVDVNDLRALLDADPLAPVTAYTGPFLDGFTVSDPAFEEWVRSERNKFHEVMGTALNNRLTEAVHAEDNETATQLAKRLLELEPYDETTTRRLMHLYAAAGNRTEAIRLYQRCEALLQDELGVAPGPQTVQVLKEITKNTGVVEPDAPSPGLFPPASPDDPRVRGRPVLAVLPFRNFSDDPDQAFFAEGLSEELIFALSAFRWFSVLGRGSSFQFSGADIDPRRAGIELGARYVLDGSVRRHRSVLRIKTALLDTATGEQLWSERYDRDIESLFEIQDDITRQIIAAAEAKLDDVEMQRAMASPAANLEAYEHIQRGYWYLTKGFPFGGDEPMATAEQHFEQATALDQHYAPALAGLANIKFRRAQMAENIEIFGDRLREADELAQRALMLAPDDPRILRYASAISAYRGRQQEALETIKRVIQICPSYASAYSGLAFTLDYVGRFDEALPAAEETIRLRPYDRTLHRCIMSKSIAHFQTGAYDEAEFVARQSLAVNPAWSLNNMMLLATLGQKGKLEEAAEPASRLRKIFPAATADQLCGMLPFAVSQHRDHLIDGLRKGGWDD
jgi:DNA-binding SARP family transcriptional activator/TolB-like protein